MERIKCQWKAARKEIAMAGFCSVASGLNAVCAAKGVLAADSVADPSVVAAVVGFNSAVAVCAAVAAHGAAKAAKENAKRARFAHLFR